MSWSLFINYQYIYVCYSFDLFLFLFLIIPSFLFLSFFKKRLDSTVSENSPTASTLSARYGLDLWSCRGGGSSNRFRGDDHANNEKTQKTYFFAINGRSHSNGTDTFFTKCRFHQKMYGTTYWEAIYWTWYRKWGHCLSLCCLMIEFCQIFPKKCILWIVILQTQDM